MSAIREHSVRSARSLGYLTNSQLPLLDENEGELPKSVEEVADRILVLNVIVSCAFGCPRPKAKAWLKKESLSACLTLDEAKYLEASSRPMQDGAMQWRVESIWALAWYMGLHDELDFSDSCSDDLNKLLPDLKADASSKSFRETLAKRSRQELLEQLDLSYCLHWAIRESGTQGQSPLGHVPPNVVIERRRALEWIAGQDSWDEVSLDT